MAGEDYRYNRPYVPGYGRKYNPNSMPFGGGQWQPSGFVPPAVNLDPMMSSDSMFNVRPQPDSFLGPIGSLAVPAVKALSGFVPQLAPLVQSGESTYNGAPTFLFRTSLANDPMAGMSAFGRRFTQANSAAGGAFGAAGADIDRRRWAGTLGSDTAGSLAMQGDNIAKSLLPGIWNGLDSFMGYDRGAAENVFGGVGGVRAMAGLRSLGGRPAAINPLGDEFNAMRQAAAANGSNIVAEAMYGRYDENGVYQGLGLSKNADVYGASEKAVAQIVERAMEGNANMVVGRDEDKNPIYERFGDLVDRSERARRAGELLERGDARTVAESDEFKQVLEDMRKSGDINVENDKVDKKVIDDAVNKLQGAINVGTRDLVKGVTSAVDSMKDMFGSEDAAMNAIDLLTGGRAFTDAGVAQSVRNQMDELKILGMNAGLAPNQIGEQLSGIAGAIGANRTGLAGGTAWGGQMAVQMARMFMNGMPIGNSRDQAGMLQAQQAYANSNAGSDSFAISTLLASMRQGGMSEDEFNSLAGMLQTGRVEDTKELKARIAQRLHISPQELETRLRDKEFIDNIGSGLNQEMSELAGRTNAAAMQNEMTQIGVSAGNRAAVNSASRAAVAAGYGARDVSNVVAGARLEALQQGLTNKDDKAKLDEVYRKNLEKFKWDEDRAAAATMQWAQKSKFVDNAVMSDEDRAKIRNNIERAGADQINARLETETDIGRGFTSEISGIKDEESGKVNSESIGQALKVLEDMGSDYGVDRKKLREAMKLNASWNVEGARKILDEIGAGMGGTNRKLAARRLGSVRYGTNSKRRADREEQKLINDALEDKEAAKYFAGVRDPVARKNLAKLAKDLRDGKAAGMSDSELAAIREKMQETVDEENRTRASSGEEFAQALESGDASKLLDVLRNRNITPEAYQAALAQLAGGVEDMFATPAELTKARLADAGSDIDKRTAILSGSSGNLGLSGLVELEKGEGGEAAMKSYASVLGLGDEKQFKAWKKQVDLASGNKGTAKKRKQAEIDRLKMEKEALDAEAKKYQAYSGEGEESAEDKDKRESRYRALKSAADKRAAQAAAVEKTDANVWDYSRKKVEDAKRDAENSSPAAIVKKLDDIIKKLEDIRGNTEDKPSREVP